MRKSIVDGVSFDCPRYVVRVPGGWQVRLPEKQTVFFGDKKYNSATASHCAAVDFRAKAKPISSLEDGSRYALVERRGKREPVGIPGVFLVRHPRRGKRAPQVELLVSVKGQPTRTIYVGTQRTWEDRLAQKLEIAQAVRNEKIKIAQDAMAAV